MEMLMRMSALIGDEWVCGAQCCYQEKLEKLDKILKNKWID